MKLSSPGTLSAIVARNVETLRQNCGWTKTELYRRLNEAGWTVAPSSSLTRRFDLGARLTIDELAILAGVFGVEPWPLTKAPDCDACRGLPPAGFTCNGCGSVG